MVLRFLLHCKGHSLMFTLSEYCNYFFINKAAVRKLWKNKTSLMNDNCPYKSNRLGQHRQDILYRKKCVLFLLIVWSNTYGTDTIEATLETKRTRTDCSSVCETYWLLVQNLYNFFLNVNVNIYRSRGMLFLFCFACCLLTFRICM